MPFALRPTIIRCYERAEHLPEADFSLCDERYVSMIERRASAGEYGSNGHTIKFMHEQLYR